MRPSRYPFVVSGSSGTRSGDGGVSRWWPTAAGWRRRTGWVGLPMRRGETDLSSMITVIRVRDPASARNVKRSKSGSPGVNRIRSIARRLGRAPSTVMRDLYSTAWYGSFRGLVAIGAVSLRCPCVAAGSFQPTVGFGPADGDIRRLGAMPAAAGRASWPPIGVCTPRCRPGCKMNSISPQQIARRLRIDFPDDAEMQVSRRDHLCGDLRSGHRESTPRTTSLSAHWTDRRKPHRRCHDVGAGSRHGQHQRAPGHRADRAVPGL